MSNKNHQQLVKKLKEAKDLTGKVPFLAMFDYDSDGDLSLTEHFLIGRCEVQQVTRKLSGIHEIADYREAALAKTTIINVVNFKRLN